MTNAERLFDLVALLMEMADSVDDCITQIDDARNHFTARNVSTGVSALRNVRSVMAIIATASRDAVASGSAQSSGV